MTEVWVTGLGFITSIGSDRRKVKESLLHLKHGISSPAMLQVPESPVKVAGIIKEFELDSSDPDDWSFPAQYYIPRTLLRSFSPHVLYAWCALQQAIEEAQLDKADLENTDTGLYTSSGGSMRSIHTPNLLPSLPSSVVPPVPIRQPRRNAWDFPPIKAQTPYIYLSVIRANRSSAS